MSLLRWDHQQILQYRPIRANPRQIRHHITEGTETHKSLSIRVITDADNNAWFVAKDVALALGYVDTAKAITTHSKKSKLLKDIGWANRPRHIKQQLDQQTKIIQESDVYRLVMRSKLESAEAFQDWVVEEVIPSIRKTGSYAADPMQALNDPATMRGLLLTYSEKVITLESTVKALEPKAKALDRISASEGSQCITDAAKALKVKPRELFKQLQSLRWIYRRAGGKNWLGYQDKIQQGLVEHKLTTVSSSSGSERVTEQALLTPKGMIKLANLLIQE